MTRVALLHSLLFAVVAIFLSACGKGISKANDVLSTNPVIPAITSCLQSLQVTADVTTSAPLLVNSPIKFLITPTYCAGYEFEIVGLTNGTRFDITKEIEKTYTNAGTFTESFTVLAFSKSRPSFVEAAQAVTKEVTITAPAGPPRPVPPPTCSIARNTTVPVNIPNAAIVIQIAASGTYSSILLNGAPAAAATPIALDPVVLNSGLYIAQAVITGPGGSTSCALTVQVPTCRHEVVSVAFAPNSTNLTLNTKTTLSGPINAIQIDGSNIPPAQFPQAPQNVLSVSNSNLPLKSGTRVTEAKVSNTFGDSASCSATYSHSVQVNVALGAKQNYVWNVGITASGAANGVFTAGGAGPNGGLSGSWNLSHGTTSIPVLDLAAAPVTRITDCAADEVMVGRIPWTGGNTDALRAEAMKSIYCRKVLPHIEIFYATSHTITWALNVNNPCPANKLMIGNFYSLDGKFTAKCAYVRIK